MASMVSPVLAMMLLQAAEEIPPTPTPTPAPLAPSDEQIFVTGTRIQAPNRTSASPVETVRKEDFTLTGVPNVEQTLNQLPQIKPSFTNTSNNPGSGAATLDLRGLGTVRTLILVNGRRWIANDAAAVPEIDVNTIPAALIDRVDIVTGGASAVYGSDAVTGVINFVLKKKLDGLYLEANNNITELGDGRSTSADLSYGTSFLGGRGNVVASVGWLDQAPILQGDRDYTRFTLNEGCIVAGSQDELGVGTPRPAFPCTAADEEPGLVRGGSSTIPQGRVVGGRTAIFIGSGFQIVGQSRFAPGGDIVPFFAATDAYNFAPDNYLQVPLQRISGHLFSSLELSGLFEPYVEMSFIRTRSPQQLAPAPGAIGTGADSVFPAQINLDNPFLSDQGRATIDQTWGVDAAGRRGVLRNSNGQIIGVNPAYTGDADGIVNLPSFTTRLSGLDPRGIANERKAYRGLLGFRGNLSSKWSYDAFYSHSYVAHDANYSNSASARRLQQAMLAIVDGSGQIVCIDQSNGCVPVNIFGQQAISDEAKDFLTIDPVEKTRVEEQIVEAVAKGDLVRLPAGDLKAVLGASWRKTSYTFTPDTSFEEGDTLGFTASIGAAGKTRVFEVFGEALAPILKDQRWAEDLSAELGLRYSNYASVGGVWTWKAMGNWSPIPEIRLRGGLQKAVRAPNARELFEEPTANFDFVLDPCNLASGFPVTPDVIAACAQNGVPELLNDQGAAALIHTGGSTDLKAETARTWTVGASIRPLAGVEATIDYFDIDIRDVIDVFGGGADLTVLGCIAGGGDPEDPLCQAFERDEDGLIGEISVPTANLARLRTKGIDWQLNTRFRLAGGQLHLGFSGTRLIASDLQANSNLDFIHRAGSFSFPKWKLFNRASWTRGPFTASLRHRYFSSMQHGSIAQNEALGLPPSELLPVNATIMQSRHYFDAAATFDLARRFQLTFGVNNLTDARPSLIGFAPQSNTDPSLYDVIGRRFFVSLSAKIH